MTQSTLDSKYDFQFNQILYENTQLEDVEIQDKNAATSLIIGSEKTQYQSEQLPSLEQLPNVSEVNISNCPHINQITLQDGNFSKIICKNQEQANQIITLTVSQNNLKYLETCSLNNQQIIISPSTLILNDKSNIRFLQNTKSTIKFKYPLSIKIMGGDSQAVLDCCYLFEKGTNIIYGDQAVQNDQQIYQLQLLGFNVIINGKIVEQKPENEADNLKSMLSKSILNNEITKQQIQCLQDKINKLNSGNQNTYQTDDIKKLLETINSLNQDFNQFYPQKNQSLLNDIETNTQYINNQIMKINTLTNQQMFETMQTGLLNIKRQLGIIYTDFKHKMDSHDSQHTIIHAADVSEISQDQNHPEVQKYKELYENSQNDCNKLKEQILMLQSQQKQQSREYDIEQQISLLREYKQYLEDTIKQNLNKIDLPLQEINLKIFSIQQKVNTLKEENEQLRKKLKEQQNTYIIQNPQQQDNHQNKIQALKQQVNELTDVKEMQAKIIQNQYKSLKGIDDQFSYSDSEKEKLWHQLKLSQYNTQLYNIIQNLEIIQAQQNQQKQAQ